MKRLLVIAGVIIAAYLGINQSGNLFSRDDATPASASPNSASFDSATTLSEAYSSHLSDALVTGEGVVVRVLADDNDGSRHQRFIVRLDSGQTLLVAHNIDIAPRVESLDEGETIAFRGEYEWNKKGGVVHWTHHDPDGSHPSGWLKHNGRTYR